MGLVLNESSLLQKCTSVQNECKKLKAVKQIWSTCANATICETILPCTLLLALWRNCFQTVANWLQETLSKLCISFKTHGFHTKQHLYLLTRQCILVKDKFGFNKGKWRLINFDAILPFQKTAVFKKREGCREKYAPKFTKEKGISCLKNASPPPV